MDLVTVLLWLLIILVAILVLKFALPFLIVIGLFVVAFLAGLLALAISVFQWVNIRCKWIVDHLRTRSLEPQGGESWIAKKPFNSHVRIFTNEPDCYVAIPGRKFATRKEWLKWAWKNRVYLPKSELDKR